MLFGVTYLGPLLLIPTNRFSLLTPQTAWPEVLGGNDAPIPMKSGVCTYSTCVYVCECCTRAVETAAAAIDAIVTDNDNRVFVPHWREITLVFWYFVRIPISCCKSSSYSSWGSTQNMKHDVIQNINRQEQNYINNKKCKAHVAYISIHTNTLGQIGESCCAWRCCFIWFLKPGLLFIWAIWDGTEFNAIMAL
jgi:hypothetical protein